MGYGELMRTSRRPCYPQLVLTMPPWVGCNLAISRGNRCLRTGRGKPVGLCQARVLARQHLREVHHHAALLPRRVVLHLAVDHVHAAAVGDRLDHLPREGDLLGIGREDLLGDVDLDRVQRPRADAAHEERRAELRLAAVDVADVAERPVEREDAGRRAGVDHAPERVVPEVLLRARPGRLGVGGVRVAQHAVAGVPAADARRLHAPRRGQVRRPHAHALHARAGGCDLLDVGDAERRLEDRVDEDRALDARARLELGEQPVDVVDVPRALDLGDHDDLEPVADLGHERRYVVERPRRLERVHARPQGAIAEVDRAADADEALARGNLAVDRNGVLEVAEQDVAARGEVGQLAGHLLVARVEEVDHPRRLERDLRDRRRGADGEGLREVAGIAHGRDDIDWRWLLTHAGDHQSIRHTCDPMTQHANAVDTDQAAREASGAHPYGRYLEEFEVGDVYKHWPAKTVTEGDD